MEEQLAPDETLALKKPEKKSGQRASKIAPSEDLPEGVVWGSDEWAAREQAKVTDAVIDDFLAQAEEYVSLPGRYLGSPIERLMKMTSLGGGRIVYQGPYEFLLYVESKDELLDGAEAFDPIIPTFAYRGLKTLVVGLSKAGKSFTTWARSADAVRLGKRVLYLTEESRGTVTDKLRTFGLEDAVGKTFFVSRRQHQEVRLLPWSEVVDRLAKDVAGAEIDLVVVDTMRPWVNLNGDESNSADRIGRALDALSPVCEAGAAVVVLHQSPWEGKRARNSTEFHAASDLIFHVEGEGEGPRTIKYVGGRVEGVPSIQTFRWTTAGGEDLGKMRHDKANRLDEVLRVIEASEQPMTAEEIASKTDYNVRSVQRWLADLDKWSKVLRVDGAMVPGHGQEPDRWTRAGTWLGLLAEE
jgi:hypothetical protein